MARAGEWKTMSAFDFDSIPLRDPGFKVDLEAWKHKARVDYRPVELKDGRKYVAMFGHSDVAQVLMYTIPDIGATRDITYTGSVVFIEEEVFNSALDSIETLTPKKFYGAYKSFVQPQGEAWISSAPSKDDPANPDQLSLHDLAGPHWLRSGEFVMRDAKLADFIDEPSSVENTVFPPGITSVVVGKVSILQLSRTKLQALNEALKRGLYLTFNAKKYRPTEEAKAKIRAQAQHEERLKRDREVLDERRDAAVAYPSADMRKPPIITEDFANGGRETLAEEKEEEEEREEEVASGKFIMSRQEAAARLETLFTRMRIEEGATAQQAASDYAEIGGIVKEQDSINREPGNSFSERMYRALSGSSHKYRSTFAADTRRGLMVTLGAVLPDSYFSEQFVKRWNDTYVFASEDKSNGNYYVMEPNQLDVMYKLGDLFVTMRRDELKGDPDGDTKIDKEWKHIEDTLTKQTSLFQSEVVTVMAKANRPEKDRIMNEVREGLMAEMDTKNLSDAYFSTKYVDRWSAENIDGKPEISSKK